MPQPRRQNASLWGEAIEKTVDSRCELCVQLSDGCMNLRHGESELGCEVPAVGETHCATTEHEPPVALDHEDEVFGHHPTRRLERVNVDVQLRRAEPVGPATPEVDEKRISDLLGLGLDPLECREHRVVMLGEKPLLLIDPTTGAVGVRTELDPVSNIERAHPETPPELAVDDRAALTPRRVRQLSDQRHPADRRATPSRRPCSSRRLRRARPSPYPPAAARRPGGAAAAPTAHAATRR